MQDNILRSKSFKNININFQLPHINFPTIIFLIIVKKLWTICKVSSFWKHLATLDIYIYIHTHRYMYMYQPLISIWCVNNSMPFKSEIFSYVYRPFVFLIKAIIYPLSIFTRGFRLLYVTECSTFSFYYFSFDIISPICYTF